jgi:SAM-dependent methyltransferase
MTFSPEWDALYRANEHLSVWPWTDLVSYVQRYARPSQGFVIVLELGCGAGSIIPFFLSLEVDYWAIEGSTSIVKSVIENYPALSNNIKVADFTIELPVEGLFDLIVDRISVAHNSTEAITKTLSLIFARLRSGGKFIGIDWFSDKHSDSNLGETFDAHTRKNLPPQSHLARTGCVHFSDREHLIDLLKNAGFEIERLEHKQSSIEIPPMDQQLANWNFVAIKP